jgi:hypothetical protein
MLAAATFLPAFSARVISASINGRRCRRDPGARRERGRKFGLKFGAFCRANNKAYCARKVVNAH